VAGCDVLRHLLDQIALAAAVPQMMMRIDDRARWIDDFFLPQCQPVFARIGIKPALRCGAVLAGMDRRSLSFAIMESCHRAERIDFHRLPAQPREAI
jgi:hypothetical protein